MAGATCKPCGNSWPDAPGEVCPTCGGPLIITEQLAVEELLPKWSLKSFFYSGTRVE